MDNLPLAIMALHYHDHHFIAKISPPVLHSAQSSTSAFSCSGSKSFPTSWSTSLVSTITIPASIRTTWSWGSWRRVDDFFAAWNGCFPFQISVENRLWGFFHHGVFQNFTKTFHWRILTTSRWACGIEMAHGVLWEIGTSWWLSVDHLHPWKLTWNVTITHFQRKIIFQSSIFVFHMNFPGCRSLCFLSGHCIANQKKQPRDFWGTWPQQPTFEVKKTEATESG